MNVLAVCSGGGVGDLMADLPAIRAIARTTSGPLTVLASAYASPVIQDQPAVRDVMFDEPSDDAKALARKLAERRFTHGIVFWSTARIAAAVHRARIPVRVGQARRLYSFRYTKRVVVRTELGDTHSHWTDVQMDYARALGAVPEPADYAIDVRLRPEDRAAADAVSRAHGLDGGFVVLHAARGILLQRVAWPVDRFAALGDALATACGLPVALTGSAADKPAIEAIGARMTQRHAALAGETSLMALAALLERARLVVALDSGPMHVAAALGAPTVGIFALRTDLPDRWRPLGPRVAVIRPSYPCPPWHRKETCPDFACYAHLDVEAVIEAARSIAPAFAQTRSAGP